MRPPPVSARRVGVWLGLLALLFAPAARGDPNTVAVVLLPGTSLRGWRDAPAPHLHRLLATGALAVMNTRTARLPSDRVRESPESALLTLGAGSRAAAPPGARADAGWPALTRLNQSQGYDLHLGNLADALAQLGIAVRAGGGPAAALVAASGSGSVLPAGRGLAPGLTVWDAGPDLAAADALLADFAAQTAHAGGLLVVLSPYVNDADYRAGRRLSPVLAWGAGVHPGLLVSPSTRRAGLVLNTDFAPSVGSAFGLTRADFPVQPFGQAWATMAAPDAARTVARLEDGAVSQAQAMRVLPYVALALALGLGLGTWLILARGELPGPAAVAPAALLAVLLVAPPPLALAFAAVLPLAAWAAVSRWGAAPTLMIICAAVTALLCLDTVTGYVLMRRGLLGYSAIEGARFYGIGNEAMGLLVGACLVAAAKLWAGTPLRRTLVVTSLALVCLLVGAPGAGAKAGGVLVCTVAFGALVFGLRGGRWTTRAAFRLLSCALVLLALTAGADGFLAHGHSHIGEAARRIRAGGLGEAGSLIARKLAVETHLAWHSLWAAPLWVGLACLVLLRRTSLQPTGSEKALFGAGLAAVAACVAFNDAGVVAGALCVVPLWCEAAARVAHKKVPPASLS